jgi:hypothetical protein
VILPAAMHREQVTPVAMEDGTAGHALATWVSQRAWIEQWAARHPSAVYCNLSGGARIDGWPAAEMCPRLLPTDERPHPVPSVAVDTTAIDGEVRRQLRAVREAMSSAAPWRSQDALLGDARALAEASGAKAETDPQRILFERTELLVLRGTEAITLASRPGDQVKLRVALPSGKGATIRMVKEAEAWKVDLVGSMTPLPPPTTDTSTTGAATSSTSTTSG